MIGMRKVVYRGLELTTRKKVPTQGNKDKSSRKMVTTHNLNETGTNTLELTGQILRMLMFGRKILQLRRGKMLLLLILERWKTNPKNWKLQRWKKNHNLGKK